MTLIARVKPAGWSVNEKLTSSQMNSLDANVKTAGDYLENVSAAPFFNPRYFASGSVATDHTPLWVERTGSTGRGFWLYNAGGTIYQSENGGSVTATGATVTGTLYSGTDNGTTGVFAGGTNSYYWTDPATFTSLAGKSARSVFWDGTNFILSRGSSGMEISSDGISWSAATTSPTNWTSSNHFAVQFATDGTTVAAVTDSTSQYVPYSTDNGANWSETSVSSLAWAGIAYRASSSPSGALWMATATTGQVYTSANGQTWTLATTLGANEQPLEKLYVINDWFVTVTSAEDIIFSKDGSTWYVGDRVSYTSNTNGRLAVGRHNLAGFSLGSTDYLWTTQSMPLLALVGV